MELLTFFLLMGMIPVEKIDAADKPAAPPIERPKHGNDPGMQIVLAHCQIEYDKSTGVGPLLLGSSTGIGKLEELMVQRGSEVKAGDVVGRLYDKEVRMDLKRVQAQLATDVEVRLGELRKKINSSKLDHAKSLTQRNRTFVSDEEMELNQFNLTEAELSLEQAKNVRNLAMISRDRLEIDLHAREITAPHDGMVVEIFKNPGETFIGTEPIIQIVDTTVLRVTGHVDASDTWRVRVGQRVKIFADLNGLVPEIENQEFTGKVVFVDTRIDKESQTFPIMAEVPNRGGLLRSGLECQMIVLLDEIDDSPAASTVPKVAKPLEAKSPSRPITPPAPAVSIDPKKAKPSSTTKPGSSQ